MNRAERRAQMIDLNKVMLNPNNKKSVEYARARSAINYNANVLHSENPEHHYLYRKRGKKEVIHFLDGKVERDVETKKLFVVFNDGSKARY